MEERTNGPLHMILEDNMIALLEPEFYVFSLFISLHGFKQPASTPAKAYMQPKTINKFIQMCNVKHM